MICSSWFLFVEDVEPEFVKNGKKQGNLFAKSFMFRLGQWGLFLLRVKRQREMTRFRDKKKLGLCLPQGTWAMDLGPCPFHTMAHQVWKIVLFITPRAWFPWDFPSSWDLWNWAWGHSVKRPLVFHLLHLGPLYINSWKAMTIKIENLG